MVLTFLFQDYGSMQIM